MSLPDTTDSFKVAVVQHAPVFLNIEQSLVMACDLIEVAASNGAKVIAFPETWLPGYPVWLHVSSKAALWDYPPSKALYRLLVETAISIPRRHLETLFSITHKTAAYVIIEAHERLGGTLYNTIIGPDAGYLAGPVFKASSILYAEIQPGRITEGHLVIDTSGHYTRPDVFRLEVDVQSRSNVTFRSQE